MNKMYYRTGRSFERRIKPTRKEEAGNFLLVCLYVFSEF